MRTCSQVRVVKLAEGFVSQRSAYDCEDCRSAAQYNLKLTAQGSNGGVDGLDKDAFTVKLEIVRILLELVDVEKRFLHTSSQLFASNKIHPSSITSAESLVT